MAVICTTLLCMYYVVVGGWVAKYAFQYIVSGDFGSDKQAYYDQFTSSAVEPIIWTLLLLALVSFLLYFGITNTVEKISKVMLPLLFALLIICGIWALFVNDNAIEGVSIICSRISANSALPPLPRRPPRYCSPSGSAGGFMRRWAQTFPEKTT